MTQEQMLMETAKSQLPPATIDSLPVIHVPIPHQASVAIGIDGPCEKDSAYFHELRFKKVRVVRYDLDTRYCLGEGYEYILMKN